MDINGFLVELLKEISHLDFVDSIDFNIEVITIKGSVILKREPYFVEIYYNEVTGTNIHKSISEKSISEILKELQRIYLRLQ